MEEPSSAWIYPINHSLIMAKVCIFLVMITSVSTIITILEIQSLHAPRPRPLRYQLRGAFGNCTPKLSLMAKRLRQAVTFLPLKDLRYADKPQEGHTWFMSSLFDNHEEGEVQYQEFPSESSNGRVLCLKGKDTHDGSRNLYALSWLETLPVNAKFMKGLTFVSYNHYSYENLWHGLSSMLPFVAWHMKNQCSKPSRWILYHWGELRFEFGPWLSSLLDATFGAPPNIERFDWVNNNGSEPVCFEKAVVMRHNEGGMSRKKRMEAYDLIRCKARAYCNVTSERDQLTDIGMTLFMRTGPRSFRNGSAVVKIFESVCAKIDGCRLRVAYSNNLTFCEQVKLMSETEILVSPHGAQLTNMFLMNRNSSVMEFFPKGWLRLAGIGQYVYHWIASWSGMKHQGAWRDPDGDNCPYPESDQRCMSVYKHSRIGFNESYFAEWANKVLVKVKARKFQEAANSGFGSSSVCACS